MNEIAREIASQPECWGRAATLASDVIGDLPGRGDRVAAVGCGTSLFVAQAYAALRESRGAGETDAFAASEAPSSRSYDAVLAISRSGTTTEVVRLLESVPPSTRTVAICGVRDAPVVAAAADAVILEFADERSVVQTRFATTTLALLRASLGEDLGSVVQDGEACLAADLPVEPSVFDQYVFLGRGWTVGLANEAALKMRETSQAWAESYPMMEYRHGPISVAGPRTLVWMLGEAESALRDDILETGAVVVGGHFDPMAELIMIQRTAVTLAGHRGLDPDLPRHLTRSVVLS